MYKVFAVIAFLGVACASAVAAASEATVKAAFQKRYPDVTVESVTKTPLAGIYEVFANGDLIYTDEKAAFLLVNANLVDTDKKKNLTEERMQKLTGPVRSRTPAPVSLRLTSAAGNAPSVSTPVQ